MFDLATEGKRNVGDRLKKTVEVVMGTAEASVEYMQGCRHAVWYDEECRKASEGCRVTKGKWLDNRRNQERIEETRHKRTIVKIILRRKKREHLDKDLDEIKKHANAKDIL